MDSRRSSADVVRERSLRVEREWLEALSYVCLTLVESLPTDELRVALEPSLSVLRGRSITYRARAALQEVIHATDV